jgi:glycosyltransferase involved in cell wall biosynthesis
VTELGAALQRRGHDVHIFTRIGPGQGDYDCIDSVHYHRCPCHGHHDFVQEIEGMCHAFLWRLGETERCLHAGFDVIHGHDWLCVRALTQARDAGRQRIFMTIHSTEYGRCGNVHRGGMSDRISHIEWEGTQAADHVVCVSGVLRQEVQRLYNVPTDKSTVVYNGVSAHQFDHSLDIGAFREQFGVGPLDPTILFVGRMSTQKGPDLLMECIPALSQHHQRAKFLFVGEGDMLPMLQRRAGELGVDHAVRFLGYRAGRQLAHLFQSADIVCVPSRNEPFGIVILEAWASGKPPVATRNGGPGEFVEHGIDGMMSIDHPDSIGWSLGTLLNDFDRARWIGENGRHKARTQFSWDNIARQTEEVYAKTA